MAATQMTASPASASGALQALPSWPVRTIAILSTLGDDGPHAIPVSAPVRAGDHRIVLSLHRNRDSLRRLRERPRAAITVLAAENVAFTARGQAQTIQEPMSTAPGYAAIALDVDQIDDHRQAAFEVVAGIDRRWLDDAERDALGERVRSLIGLEARGRNARLS